MKKEIKISYLLFFVVVLGYLLQYALNVFLANQLSPAYYGDYSVAIRLLDILVALSLFGTDTSVKRFLANYLNLDNKSTATNYIAWNIKIVSVSFIIIFMLAIISILTMSLLHVLGIRHISQYHLAAYMLWIAPFAAIGVLLSNYLLCTERIIIPTVIFEILRYLVELIFFIIITLFFGITLNNISIVSVLFASFILLALFTLILMNNEVLSMLKSGLKRIGSTRIIHAEWFFISRRLIVCNIVFFLTSILDLIIVELFAKSESDIGHYAAVLTICGWILLPSMNLYQPLKIKANEFLKSSKGKIDFQKTLDITNKVVIFLTALLSVTILCFTQSLLGHFGQTYINAKNALIILVIGSFISGISRFSAILLIYAGFERIILMLNFAQLILIVIFAIPATYYFGITGTAIATSGTLIISAITAIFLVRKKLGMRSLIWV